MGSLSNYAENKILDHLTGKTSYTMPTIYVALSTTDPREPGSGTTDPSGNNHSRVTTSGSTWNSASNGSTTNNTDITFPTASGSWGTVQYGALYDAANNGNMIAYGTLNPSKTVGDGDVFKILAGNLNKSIVTGKQIGRAHV